jgi:hypothetical protein
VAQNFTFNGVTATNGNQIQWATNSLFTGSTTVVSPTNIAINGVAPGTTTTVYIRGINSTTGCVGGTVTTTATVGLNTFLGTGDWTSSNAASWSCGTVPAAGDPIAIAGNATLKYDRTLTGSLIILNGGTLTVDPTITLAVGTGGTVNFNDQAVTFRSTATGTARLGKVDGTLSGATNVTVERFIPANTKRAWRMLSIPTKDNGQSINAAWQEGQTNATNTVPNRGTLITSKFANWASQGFDALSSTSGSMQTYNPATNTFVDIANTGAAIETQKGYALYVRGDRSVGVNPGVTAPGSTTLRTNGTLYTGTLPPVSVSADKFELIGNTYVSPINFTALAGTGGINPATATFYIWDPKAGNTSVAGAYQTFNPLNGYKPFLSGSYAMGVANTTIETGLAFMVKSNGTSGTIGLTEAAKVTTANNAYRPAPLRPMQQFKASLVALASGNDRAFSDGNLVVFDNAYSDGADEADAQKLANNTENFGVLSNNSTYVVDARKGISSSSTIQYNMWNLHQSKYQLEFSAAEMEAAGITATLEDKYLGTSTPVSLTGETVRYSFTTNSDAGSKAKDRFKVVFSTRPSIAAQAGKAGFVVSPNPVEGSRLNVQFTNQPKGRYTLRLLSMEGKAIQTTVAEHAGGKSTQLLNLSNKFAAGTYQLEIIGADKVKTVVRVIVNDKR